MMESLKIPYGLNDSGELVEAENAVKSNSYSCPSCGTKLVHRSGEERAKHFAHPSNSNCSLETVLHKTAKCLIKNAIVENSIGKPIQL